MVCQARPRELTLKSEYETNRSWPTGRERESTGSITLHLVRDSASA